MNVIFAFVTTELPGEPHFRDSFIAGYESAGGVWSGTITVYNSQSYNSVLNTVMPWALANDHKIVVTNFGGIGSFMSSAANQTAFRTYYDQGVTLVAPAGSNYYHDIAYITQIHSPVIAGAGVTENMTGYHCEFFDEDPYKEVLNITNVVQEGVDVTLTHSYSVYSFYSTAMYIQEITGFENNPDGTQSYTYVTPTSTRIVNYNLGAGSFIGTNTTGQIHFQSYTTPYLAGKIAYLMDEYGFTAEQARERLRWTSDYRNNFYSGFGKPNLSSFAALNPTRWRDLTPGNITHTRGLNLAVTLTWDKINTADQYEIYRDNNLITTIDVKTGINAYTFYLTAMTSKSNPYRYRYRGIEGDRIGNFSNSTTVNYVKSPYLKLK